MKLCGEGQKLVAFDLQEMWLEGLREVVTCFFFFLLNINFIYLNKIKKIIK